MMTLKKNKVVLGLSGGVDSTAAALLLENRAAPAEKLLLPLPSSWGLISYIEMFRMNLQIRL